MIFTFLITIVFIAELIIAMSIIIWLLRLDRKLNNLCNTVKAINPEIKEICVLGRKISSQIKELSTRFVDKVKDESDKFLTDKLIGVILGAFVLKINNNAIKKFRKTKLAKTLSRGLSLLQIVI